MRAKVLVYLIVNSEITNTDNRKNAEYRSPMIGQADDQSVPAFHRTLHCPPCYL